MSDVAVIGAGIIGIGTALYIKKKNPNLSVVVFGEQLTPFTTGDNAAGLWTPYKLNETPIPHVLKWSKKTWDFVIDLMRIFGAEKSGCYTEELYELSSTNQQKAAYFQEVLPNYRALTQAELDLVSPSFKHGFAYTTMIMEGTRLIPLLMQMFTETGGVIRCRRVESFDELYKEGHKVIVNCTGLFGGTLAKETEPLTFPIRGQIMRVRAPWINKAYMIDDAWYIIPRCDFVVLGGTSQVGDWDTKVNERDRQRILEGVSKVFPELKNPHVLGEWVGLRPGRKQVRIEVEKCRINGQSVEIVHNYGHGGAGLTLFWGCAEEAGEMVLQLCQQQHLGKEAKL